MIVVFVLVLLALALIGVPLFVIMGAATALCFYWFTGDHHSMSRLLVILQSMEGLLTKQEFLAIPLFMASGAIMTKGGIAARLVEIARAALGWMPGGLAVASVAACIFFAAISGSSVVTLIAVGSIMFPAMIKSGYPENFSLGLVTTAGSLGCLVPPSLAMLIYAISISSTSAKVNPQDMFLAGLIPALFIGGLLALYAVWVGLKVKGSREKFEWTRLRLAIREGSWALALPFVVLGGIYGGFFTPSEAGAVATVYALFVTMGVYREMTLPKMHDALVEAATLMGTLILIIVLSFGLNDFLNDIQLNEKLIAWIQSMHLGPFGFMLLTNLILIVLGALMDSISCTLIFAPILAPIAWEVYGIDPLHFGIVFVVNMEIGYLAPPVATNLFVSAAVFKKPFGQVVRAVMPTLGITCAALVAVMYIPTISKAAINLKTGKPLYEPFPWDGKPALAADAPGGANGVPSDDLGALTAEVMAEASVDAGTGETEVDPDEDPYGLGATGDEKKKEEEPKKEEPKKGAAEPDAGGESFDF